MKLFLYSLIFILLFSCNARNLKDDAKKLQEDAKKINEEAKSEAKTIVESNINDAIAKANEDRFLNKEYAEEKSIKKLKDPKEISKVKSIFTEANTLYKIKKNKESLSKYEEGLEIATDAEAYYRYGNVLSNLERYEDSIKAYDISIAMGFDKEYYSIYNKACSYSRLKKAEEAFENIFLAVDKGYKAITYMQEDPDLEFLRSLPDWKNKYKEIKKRAKEKEELEKSKG